MLHFSPQALQIIEQAIAGRDPQPAGLRVGVFGSPCSGGLQYVIRLEAQPSHNDQLIDCQGLTLIIDSDSLTQLEGIHVDYLEAGDRKGFTFENPNQNRSCSGCAKAS